MVLLIRIIFLLLVYFFIYSSPVFALNNGDFESGEISPWETYSGAMAEATIEQFHSGARSVKIGNDSTSSYGIQQVVTNIEAGKTYRLSGFSKVTDSNLKRGFLRIAWYESPDGTGSQKSKDDSNEISGVSDWSEVILEKEAPSGVNSAKVRAVVASLTSGINVFAYFDDLNFTEIFPSPSPIPSPVSSPSPSPTPTHKASPTLKSSVTPTPTFSRTPTPSPKTASSSPSILATGVSLVLGETVSSLAASTEAVLADFESPPATPAKETKILPKILLILAGLATLIMVFSAFWLRKKKPL